MAVSSSYYRYIYKDSTRNVFSSVETDTFLDSYDNGNIINIFYPLSSSISVYYITASSDPNYTLCSENNAKKIHSLTNAINYYKANSNFYNIDYYKDKTVTLIDIPAVIYGSSVKKGSVSLKMFYTGSLIGELRDIKQNGELIEVFGSNISGTAGIVLYNEGFILLTGSWSLDDNLQDGYRYCSASFLQDDDSPRWVHWGRGLDGANTLNTTFDIDFEGTTKINTLTMFAHAPKSQLNFSSNPTFVEFSNQNKAPISGSNFYIETEETSIKNTVKSDYVNTTASFERQVFINKIGIFDKDKKLIAIAKLATPVKKTEQRALTFKLKLDT